MNKSPYISIIMPVYNSARFVKKALDSIISQNFFDYEILLINDGSADESITICQEYSDIYPSIRLIDKSNEGVAITRNKGIEEAYGEYIFFIDSDDIIFPDTLGHVVNVLKEKQPDLLRYEFQTIDTSGNNFSPNYEVVCRRKYANKIMAPSEFMQRVMRKEYQLCFNVFRRKLLIQQHLRFMEGCTYNEDTLFIVRYLSCCKTCLYLPVLCYGYRKYEDAVTAKFTEKNFKDVFNVFANLNILTAETQDKQLADNILRVSQRLGFSIYKYLPQYGTAEHKEEILGQCLKKPLIMEWEYIYYWGECLGTFFLKVETLATKVIRKLRYKFGKVC